MTLPEPGLCSERTTACTPVTLMVSVEAGCDGSQRPSALERCQPERRPTTISFGMGKTMDKTRIMLALGTALMFTGSVASAQGGNGQQPRGGERHGMRQGE